MGSSTIRAFTPVFVGYGETQLAAVLQIVGSRQNWTQSTNLCSARARSRSLRCHPIRRLPIHRHMARLGLDTCEPGADRRKRGEVEIAFMRQVRVGVEREGGDAVAI